MIRPIRLGDQIEGMPGAFAFYNTVTGTFVTIAGEDAFRDVADLRDAISCEPEHPQAHRNTDLIGMAEDMCGTVQPPTPRPRVSL